MSQTALDVSLSSRELKTAISPPCESRRPSMCSLCTVTCAFSKDFSLVLRGMFVDVIGAFSRQRSSWGRSNVEGLDERAVLVYQRGLTKTYIFDSNGTDEDLAMLWKPFHLPEALTTAKDRHLLRCLRHGALESQSMVYEVELGASQNLLPKHLSLAVGGRKRSAGFLAHSKRLFHVRKKRSDTRSQIPFGAET